MTNEVRDAWSQESPIAERDAVDDLVSSGAEDRALFVAILISVISAFLLSALTFGVFLVFVLVSLGTMIAGRHAARADMVLVGPEKLPVVDQLARTAAFRLGIRPIDVFVQQSPEFNAFTSGFGRGSWIVVNSALVRDFTPAELLYVIGHELGHVRRRHVFWNRLIGIDTPSPIPLAGPFLRFAFNGWSRAAEYAADRAGVLAARSPEPCARALLKLAVGTDTARHMDPTELGGGANPTGETLASLMELGRGHPLVAHRIRSIGEFWERVAPGPAWARSTTSEATR